MSYQRHFPPALRGDPTRIEYRGWDGLTLRIDHYEPAAQADATVIVVHGGGGHGRLLAPVGVVAVRLNARAIVPDLPGYGETPVPRRRFTYELWVRCVKALAEAEHRDGAPVILAGASMGGMLALHAVAAGAPAAGVLATTLLEPRDPRVRRHLGRFPAAADAAARLLGVAPWLTDGLPVPMRLAANMRRIANDRAIARAINDDRAAGGNVVPARFLRSWLTYRPERELDALCVPVLLAHPGDDRWTPTAISLLAFERLAGPKRFVELPNCSHLPIESPGVDVLEREFAAWIAQLKGATPGADLRLSPV